MLVLVTRPEPDGQRTATALRGLGCDVMLAPLLHVQAVDADLGGAWDVVALTSVNAVRAIASHPKLKTLIALPAYAVGGRTADAAVAQGFINVISADGDASDLVRVMKTHLRPGARALYLAGEDIARDLAGDLAAASIDVDTRIVYRAVAASGLPPQVCDALVSGRIEGVLHFSRRTAKTYIDCAATAGISGRALAPQHYCLSRQVAEPLAAAGARGLRIAARPTEAALLDLVKG